MSKASRLWWYMCLWIGILLAGGCMLRGMPGKSHRGELPALSAPELAMAGRLREDVSLLAGSIGERNLAHYRQLQRTAAYLQALLGGLGYGVREQLVQSDGKQVMNLEAEVPGRDRAAEIIVVGAHYDSVAGSPGANDNASGVAAMLELARHFRGSHPSRTIRFVAFVNEEPPYFQTPRMGSLVYATAARKRNENIVAMISLETIGYYSDHKGSQQYPTPLSFFYPDTGNFIGFVADVSSGELLRDSIKTFRDTTAFPSEGLAAPRSIVGVGWSDHWAFWQNGYPAFMVTDTALFRYPYYHQPSDTPEKLDYERMARVVSGMEKVVEALADPGKPPGRRSIR